MPRHDLLPNERRLEAVHATAQHILDRPRCDACGATAPDHWGHCPRKHERPAAECCPYCHARCEYPLVVFSITSGPRYGPMRCVCGARKAEPFTDLYSTLQDDERRTGWFRPVKRESVA